MGIPKLIQYATLCACILICGYNLVAASDQGERIHSDIFCSTYSDEFYSSVISEKTVPQVLEIIPELRTGGWIQGLRTGAKVSSSETGWQNITIPAVISEPGLYRVINNYSASSIEVGILITSSDVVIDGNGHAFKGDEQHGGYGVIAYNSSLPLSNITVSDIGTQGCTAGIGFYEVQGGHIFNTSHISPRVGLFTGLSQSVSIHGNSISDFPDFGSENQVIGIIGMDCGDIAIQGNHISNTTSPVLGEKSSGIILYNCSAAEIINNSISDTVIGIATEGTSAVDISDNVIYNNRDDGSGDEIVGIIGFDAIRTQIESNTIENITPDTGDISSFGISLSNSTDSIILGNTISDARIGIQTDSSQAVSINYNLISGQWGEDLESEILGIFGMDNTALRISSNRINITCTNVPFGLKSDGISITNCTYSGITGNEVGGALNLGIASYNDETPSRDFLEISDNRVDFTYSTGISVLKSKGLISNNSVKAGEHGLLLMMDDSLITKNHLQNNHLVGLGIFGTNLTIAQNLMINNAYNFYIEGPTPDYFRHHIDQSNLANGRPIIYIREGVGNSVSSSDNPSMVIAADCRDLTITNLSTGANGAGVIVSNVTNGTVSGLSDTGSLTGLAAFWSREFMITNSSSKDNRGYGFAFQEVNDTELIGCTVSNSSGIGYLVRSSEDTELHSCKAGDFGQSSPDLVGTGILIDQSRDIEIESGSFSHSPEFGIEVLSTEGLAVNSSYINDSGMSGVFCRDSSLISVNNTVLAGNFEAGLSLINSTGFILTRNIIRENVQTGLSFSDSCSGLIYDNLFNNSYNVVLSDETAQIRWNTTLTPGRNMVNGSSVGGNFWADPNGQGFSETHADRGDGICNASYALDGVNIDYLPLAIPSGTITADFTADQISGTPPLTVQFTDQSTGYPVQWNWTFGDGTRSGEQHPIHSYQGIGRYTVTLEVTDNGGNQGVLRRPVYIDVNAGYGTGPSGMLWVSSSPDNASVFLDARYIGSTPLRASGIHAGSRQILLSHEGYQNWSGLVTIQPNQFTYVPKVILRKTIP